MLDVEARDDTINSEEIHLASREAPPPTEAGKPKRGDKIDEDFSHEPEIIMERDIERHGNPNDDTYDDPEDEELPTT